jgi:hypothetical protein
MKKNIQTNLVAKSLATVIALTFAVGPLPALAQGPASVDAAAVGSLSTALAQGAVTAESGARSKSQNSVETQSAIESALEQSIATSGVDPATALAALDQTQVNMRAAGTLTPPIAAAIAAVAAKIRAALRNGPSAVGARSGPPSIGAPSSSGGGGGGSDYRAG